MKKLLTILACLGIAIYGCQKKTNPVVNLDTDPGVKMHFNFKPGSYWVYVDSLTGRVDSFFVTSNFFTKVGDPNATFNYHYISISEVCEDTTFAADSAKWVWDLEGNKIIVDYYYNYRTDSGWKYDVGYNPLVNYPFKEGLMVSEYDRAFVSNIDSIFTVSGRMFDSVAEVHHYVNADTTARFGVTTINDWYNINDSVGIVSMQLYHPHHAINHYWRLVRFNVVKQ